MAQSDFPFYRMKPTQENGKTRWTTLYTYLYMNVIQIIDILTMWIYNNVIYINYNIE